MSAEDREFYMIGKVLPSCTSLFARHDAQEYSGFSCESCHGTNMREVSYAMPVATIYRLPEPGSSGWRAMEATQGEAVRFMRDEVTSPWAPCWVWTTARASTATPGAERCRLCG
ncbi:MAG: hypothetical protein IPG17_25360 [Sandaracinaceae bacterium]|nr:hypothetical protein [Sandaracinaceae bacterium]